MSNGQEPLARGISEDIKTTIGRPTVAEITLESVKRFQDLEAHVRDLFQEEADSGLISAKEIHALAIVIGRGPDPYKICDYIGNNLDDKESAFAYALGQSSVALPWLTLREYCDHTEHITLGNAKWGYQSDGNFILPRSESTTDSNVWGVIRSMFDKYNIKYTEDESAKGFPKWENSSDNKIKTIHQIMVRVLELGISPASATIRRSPKLTENEVIKNAVDFVYLYEGFQLQKRHGKHGNLAVSYYADTVGRRQETVVTPSEKIRKVRVGYRLAEIICKTIPDRESKSFEGEPAYQLIHGILIKLLELNFDKFEVPKAFFERPSMQVRLELRCGPRIENKKGEHINYYMPFSFVKSSEFAFFPEATKKLLADKASGVNNTIDLINNQSLDEANSNLPLFRGYIRALYALSDTIKREWVVNYLCPSIANIQQHLGDNVLGTGSFSREQIQKAIELVRASPRKMVFTKPTDDPDSMERIKISIESIKKVRLERQKAAKAKPHYKR